VESKLREFKVPEGDCEIAFRDDKAKAKDRKPEEVAVDMAIDCIVRKFL
jgi:hypothetical protein